ncbi:MAG: hypothetical protein EBR82_27770 [Caulobacteraceae bacterium]|nr:hypothetical protein [Caulobacteraceae bacterium]
MASPTVDCFINFSSGANFGQALLLDSGQLDLNILADSTAVIVDVSAQVQNVSITRGRNAQSDAFQTGTASVRIADVNGDFNPQNTSSPYAGLLLPLRKIVLNGVDNNTGLTYPLFAGYITGYNYTQAQVVGEVSYTTLTAVDGFRLLNLGNVTTVSGSSAGQLSGQRITNILDSIAWPTSMRDIDAGLTTLQADPGTSRTALNALQTVELSEYGAVYMDPAGNFVFQDRALTSSSVSGSSTTFADDGTGIEYGNVRWVLDDTLIYNKASITATGLATQTASNQDSIDKYFLHSYTKTDLLMQTTAEALNYAQAYVASRQETTVRCDAVTLKDLNTAGYNAGIVAALGLDYFDTITVKSTQPNSVGTSTLNKTLQVFGVSHNITPSTWITTFTTLEPIIDSFILDSSLYGLLDSSVLSY